VRDFGYRRPASLDELWRSLEGLGDACLLAGGTDLVPSLKRENRAPDVLVDIKRLPELAGIAGIVAGGLRIGAVTTLHETARSPEVYTAFPALAEAAATVASHQVRNRGTVGGNVCLDTRCPYFNQSSFWRLEYPDCRKMGGGSCYVVPRGDRCHALSSSDLAPLLVALGAEVEVVDPGGGRRTPLEDLFDDDGLRSTILGEREVVAALHLPVREGRCAYRRAGARETVDFPLAVGAAFVDSEGARLVFGGVASRPVRAHSAEVALAALVSEGAGTPTDVGAAAAAELPIMSGARASIPYVRRLIAAIVTNMAVELTAARERGD
jgi:4-hydroxybenzoyl-CoA reductase subunit beta